MRSNRPTREKMIIRVHQIINGSRPLSSYMTIQEREKVDSLLYNIYETTQRAEYEKERRYNIESMEHNYDED